MSDARDRLPPVIRLLLEEDLLGIQGLEDLRRFVADRSREYRVQAQWTADNYAYEEHSPQDVGKFIAFPAGGLDMFAGDGSCQNLECRIGYVLPFARTLGVYADAVYLSDRFTPFFRRKGRRTWQELSHLMGDLLVLKSLQPLVDAGALRFKVSKDQYCLGCLEKMCGRVGEITDRLQRDFASEIRVVRKGRGAPYLEFTGHGGADGFITRWVGKRGAAVPEDDELRRGALLPQVASVLLASASAAKMGGAVVSDSRYALSALLEAEGRRPVSGRLLQWEDARSATLPWIESLTVQQVVELREAAAIALPRLRERLAVALRPLSPEDQPAAGKLDDLIAELREEAAEVQAELLNLRRTGGRRFANVLGGLGLTISGYGFFSDSAAAMATLGNLLALLGITHQADKDHTKEGAAATSRPGYVLLQAQDILRHAAEKQ